MTSKSDEDNDGSRDGCPTIARRLWFFWARVSRAEPTGVGWGVDGKIRNSKFEITPSPLYLMPVALHVSFQRCDGSVPLVAGERPVEVGKFARTLHAVSRTVLGEERDRDSR